MTILMCATQAALAANEWHIVPIVDEFKEPVPGQYNIATTVEGEFSNSATSKSRCTAILSYAFYASSDLIVKIKDYGNIKKSHFSRTRYQVKIRYPGGETAEFIAVGQENSDEIHIQGVKGLQNGTNKILINATKGMDEYLLTVDWNAEGEAEKAVKAVFKAMDPLTEAQLIERVKSGLHKDSTILFKGVVGSLQAASTGGILIVLKGGIKIPVQIPTGIKYKRTTNVIQGKGGISKSTQINDYAEIYSESNDPFAKNNPRHEIKTPPTLAGSVKEGDMSKFLSRDILTVFRAADVFNAGAEVTFRVTFDKDGGYGDIEIVNTTDTAAAWIFKSP